MKEEAQIHILSFRWSSLVMFTSYLNAHRGQIRGLPSSYNLSRSRDLETHALKIRHVSSSLLLLTHVPQCHDEGYYGPTMALYDKIFAAVFPPSADVVTPTPTATPVLGSTAFGESFGDPSLADAGYESAAAEQIRWDRAWHTATAYLSLANEPITTADVSQDGASLRAKWIKPFTSEVSNAVSYLLSEDSPGRVLRKDSGRDDLLQWYYEEVSSRHFVIHVLPGLIEVWTKSNLLYDELIHLTLAA